jgi:predicted HicB family RNase H-like nuclease
VAALAAIGVIKLERVANDGVRVRANAGAASFRRREKLTKQLGMARELVRTRASARAQLEGISFNQWVARAVEREAKA